jgi:sugar phosphate isomerase/epimerase
MSIASTISAVGFCTYTGDGNFSTLESALHTISNLGANAAELSLYGEELISGGRIIPGRAERLTEITKQFDLRYSVHGQIISNFMDKEHLQLQKAVVRAMLELCNRVEAGILVHHCGQARMPALTHISALDLMERDALAEMQKLPRGMACV